MIRQCNHQRFEKVYIERIPKAYIVFDIHPIYTFSIHTVLPVFINPKKRYTLDIHTRYTFRAKCGRLHWDAIYDANLQFCFTNRHSTTYALIFTTGVYMILKCSLLHGHLQSRKAPSLDANDKTAHFYHADRLPQSTYLPLYIYVMKRTSRAKIKVNIRWERSNLHTSS